MKILKRKGLQKKSQESNCEMSESWHLYKLLRFRLSAPNPSFECMYTGRCNWDSENYPSPLPADVLLVVPMERAGENWQSEGDKKQLTRFCVLEVCVISKKGLSCGEEQLIPAAVGSSWTWKCLSTLSEVASMHPLRGARMRRSQFLLRGLSSSSAKSFLHVSEAWMPVVQHHLLKDLVPNSTGSFCQASNF